MHDISLRFTVQTSSGLPIYRQIMEQVCALIAGGRLSPGELLPSVRQLAAELEVNMMTISKAYARLGSRRCDRAGAGHGDAGPGGYTPGEALPIAGKSCDRWSNRR